MAANDSISYGTRKNECYRIYDNDLGFVNRENEHVKFLINKWNQIEDFEISKRKNGKVLSKLILMFPNEWTLEKKEQIISEFLESKFNKNHHFTFCFHEGKKGEIAHNSHGHLYYSERNMNDPKKRKNPSMSKLGYIKDFSKEWQKVCGVDLSKNPKVKRIAMKEWKANPSEARFVKQNMKNLVLSEQKTIDNVHKKVEFSNKLILRLKHSFEREIKIDKRVNTNFNTENNTMPANSIINLLQINSQKKESEKRKKLLEKQNALHQKNDMASIINEIIDSGKVSSYDDLIFELEECGISISFDRYKKEFLFESYDNESFIESIDLHQNLVDTIEDLHNQKSFRLGR